MRTALYIRFSSRRQVQGASLSDQLARLRSEAQAGGETIVAEFIDQAQSGATAATRKEYQALLAAARRHEFDRVRVESVDRGHRNDFDRRAFEQEMEKLRIQVIYSGEPERQAPSQRKLQRGIRGVLAEWESDETSQRTYKRHLHRAKKGKWRGGPLPCGLLPDSAGWFKPDPDSYPTLLWLLERRAEGNTYHTIARMLNRGISLNGEPPAVPPTPGLLAYRRKPYKELQDPETGDVLQQPRPMPSAAWGAYSIKRICGEVLDGVYAGILHWGERYNRFHEDGEGNPKEPVRFDTGKPLIPLDLLHRVQGVELAFRDGSTASTIVSYNDFLLDLRCGSCGGSIHGYTSTKYKQLKATGETRSYKYRKYRCIGRVNKVGSCKMPMLSAEMLEQAVLETVFNDARQWAPERLAAKLLAAAERRKAELERAVDVLRLELQTCSQQRDNALDSIADRTLPETVRSAMVQRAEAAVQRYEALETQQHALRAGMEVLNEQARTIELILLSPQLDPQRWQEPVVAQIIKRALHLLVHKAELHEEQRGAYHVKLWLYREEFLLFRESVANESADDMACTTFCDTGYTEWLQMRGFQREAA